ncbi:MAG: polymer-forming cytoskeletal protein [Candidatus Thermoplasmatota archaeon]|nr:polymer-forming cytoskeletal protein [Candidatus Thermoplasmatota archaeon]
MVFDRKTLVIPNNTKFEEKNIVTNGDVVIGDRCLIQFGIKTDGRIFIGEHVIIDGNLDATEDIRVDIFSNIGGSVKSGGNVYFGEKVKVKGKLSLNGDLDVGDSVEIDQGFEAKGWINIRSPIPIVIYVFIYLMQLLKMGHSEEIERILSEIEENDEDMIPISEIFLFIPNNSIIGVQKSKIDYNVKIGKKTKILGNYDIKGNIFIEENTIFHGSLKVIGDVFCDKKVKIQGNIDSSGNVKIEDETNIAGKISAEKIFLSKTSSVNGELFAKNGISFKSPSKIQAEEKVERFEKDTDIVDEVDNLLE